MSPTTFKTLLTLEKPKEPKKAKSVTRKTPPVPAKEDYFLASKSLRLFEHGAQNGIKIKPDMPQILGATRNWGNDRYKSISQKVVYNLRIWYSE